MRLIGDVVDRVGRGAHMAVANRGPGALVSVGAVDLLEGNLPPVAGPKVS